MIISAMGHPTSVVSRAHYWIELHGRLGHYVVMCPLRPVYYRLRTQLSGVVIKLRMLTLFRWEKQFYPYLQFWYTDVWLKDASEQVCCSGRECGCRGADYYWQWSYEISEETKRRRRLGDLKKRYKSDPYVYFLPFDRLEDMQNRNFSSEIMRRQYFAITRRITGFEITNEFGDLTNFHYNRPIFGESDYILYKLSM
jgi:hypothetical protein